ncbi:C-type lectin domain family 4 member M isoform X2 [Lates calcarifer]|uniref:C-type lectin domain family 4 member M isoform X2 n=1 Tax=Lates calcarifer TaxID=8187 RepID=A0AAJ8B308_LATCA|nr:C-type lectin domain family 4 member M isoform X2 [Lates calcarifer]
MSSDIYAKPDLSKKVRYNRKVEEDGAEWEEREVNIYESTDRMGDNHTDLQSQEGGPQTQKLPPVQTRPYRAAALCVGVLCLLMMAGVIVLSTCYVSVTLEKEQLQIRYNDLNNSYTQLQGQLSDTKGNNSQLQSRYETLSENHSQLQDEVKRLKEKLKDVSVTLEKEQLQTRYNDLNNSYTQLQEQLSDMAGNNTQLQSRYETLSENHSQLQDEVKRLKEKLKDVSVTLEKEQLQTRYNDLNNSYTQLQGQLSVNNSQLQSRYETLSENHTQLQDEVKRLKEKLKDVSVTLEKEQLQTRYNDLNNSYTQLQGQLSVDNSQLQSRYETLSENHTQLQDEVKRLKEKLKDVSVTLEKEQLQTRYNDLNNSYTQLQGQLSDMKDMAGKNTQLQDEVKTLKEKLKEKRCPGGWERFGCSCYFKSTEEKTWSESRTDCQSRGADLVIINSKEEQEFVSNLNVNGLSWIGLTTKQKTGSTWEWEWVDGSLLTETFWPTRQIEDPTYRSRVACCDQQGKWTQRYYYYYARNWICEK